MTLPSECRPHPISWRPEQNKQAEQEGILLVPPGCFELEHQSFPNFGLKLKHGLFLILEPSGHLIGTHAIGCPGSQAFRLRLELHAGFAGSPSYWFQILGWLHLCNHMSPFYNSVYTHTHAFCWFFSSEGPRRTQWVGEERVSHSSMTHGPQN